MLPSASPSFEQAAPALDRPPSAAVGVPSNLLEQANRLNDKDRQLLVAFLKGEAPAQQPTQGVRQILLNEVRVLLRMRPTVWQKLFDSCVYVRICRRRSSVTAVCDTWNRSSSRSTISQGTPNANSRPRMVVN